MQPRAHGFDKLTHWENPLSHRVMFDLFMESLKINPMPFVYILECSDGSYYTGSTWNLEQRVSQHLFGAGGKYTGLHQPVNLVYSEEYERMDEAYAREKQIQGWTRRKKKALIDGDFKKLVNLSRNFTQFGKPEE